MNADEFDKEMKEHSQSLNYRFNRIAENLWILRRRDSIPFFIRYTEISEDRGIISIYAKVMKLPKKNLEEFYKFLLKVNYRGLLHGYFALNSEEIVLKDTFPSSGTPSVEFFASIATLERAWKQYKRELESYGKVIKH